MAVANIRCPFCKSVEKIEIPKDKCLPFYRCNKCKKIVKAKNMCCVICEYSDKKCPVSVKKTL